MATEAHRYYVRIRRQHEGKTTTVGPLDDNPKVVVEEEENRRRPHQPNQMAWNRLGSKSLQSRAEKSQYDIYGRHAKSRRDYPPGPEILSKLKTDHLSRGPDTFLAMSESSSESVKWEEQVNVPQHVIDVDLESRMDSAKELSAVSIHTMESKTVEETTVASEPLPTFDDVSSYVKPSVMARQELALRANQTVATKDEALAVVQSADNLHEFLERKRPVEVCTCSGGPLEATVVCDGEQGTDDRRRVEALRRFLRDNGSALHKDLKVSSADGKSFKTCRLLMAALSEHVREMERHTDQVVVEGVTGKSLEVLLEWIEMADVSLTPDLVHDVFRAATMLRVDSLTAKCDDYLSALRDSKKYKKVPKASPNLEVSVDELCRQLVLEDDPLTAYQMLCSWLLHQWDERRQFESVLLDCIDFTHFEPEQLRDLLDGDVNPLAHRRLVKEKVLAALLKHVASDRAVRSAPTKTLSAARPCPVHAFKQPSQAAIAIQSSFRGYRQRRQIRRQQEAAVNIQRMYRGYRTRRQLRQENEAAAIIQSGYLKFMDSRRRQLLFDSLQKHGARVDWTPEPPSIRETFVPSSGMFVCLGGLRSDDDDDDGHIYCYEDNREKWSVIGSLPKALSEMAACLLGTHIYVTGGRHGHLAATSGCWCWDLESGYWHSAADMLEKRRSHHLVPVNGQLYAVGGCGDGDRVLSSMECYDPSGNRWKASVPLEIPRYAAAVTVHAGNIWVCGGVAEIDPDRTRKITDRVDIYQPAKLRWTRYGRLPAPRAFADAVSVNPRMLYVVGGVEYHSQNESVVVSNVVLAFDQKAGGGEWRHLTDLRCPRYKANAIYREPYLVVVGGVKQVSGSLLTTVECFDTDDGRWLALPDLPVALQGTCLVAV